MEFNSLKEALNAEIGFWEWLPYFMSEFYGYVVFLTILCGALSWIIIKIEEIKKFTTKTLIILGIFVGGFAFGYSLSYLLDAPNMVYDNHNTAIVHHVEENYDVRNVVITDTNHSDDLYQVEMSFDHANSAYKYESKMSYNDNYGVMVPVIHADYDTVPVKDGSDVAEVLETTENVLAE